MAQCEPFTQVHQMAHKTPLEGAMWHPHDHVMCHPTPNVSKNVKFQLSHNPMKFDRVTRFREMNSTVKSVSSSEI